MKHDMKFQNMNSEESLRELLELEAIVNFHFATEFGSKDYFAINKLLLAYSYTIKGIFLVMKQFRDKKQTKENTVEKIKIAREQLNNLTENALDFITIMQDEVFKSGDKK